MRKEAKRKARLEQRKARRNPKPKLEKPEDKMHDIHKPITLDDLTDPEKISLNEIVEKKEKSLSVKN